MKPENMYIPYTRTGEPDHTAAVTAVETDTASLSDRERALLACLSAAADTMNAVYRDQCCSDTEDIIDMLTTLSPYTTKTEQAVIENYMIILDLQNCPWSFIPRKNHLLDLAPDILRKAAEKAGQTEKLKALEHYLYSETPFPDRAMFYPEELSEKDLKELGEEGTRINTRILAGDGGTFSCVLNEDYYREACREAMGHLKKARDLTDNISFRLYLDAKIEELAGGSEEARRLADYHWIHHDNPIDIVISTAIEVYLDNWKNQKGAAGAAVMLENASYREFLDRILALVPDMEKRAPWKWRRETIDKGTLPKLKYVDVINWSGDYISSPMTVLAQSLPNDEWVGKNIGTVNMVYLNTSRASFDIRMKPLCMEVFPEKICHETVDALFEGHTLHSTLHEIGHTTGRQDPDHQGQPSSFFQKDYSALEESRAELFGMWASDFLAEEGVISGELRNASHNAMLLSMITALRFEPVQAHNIARNIIFHFLTEKKVIRAESERDITVFSLDFDGLGPAVETLLGTLGDIKASGDKDAFTELKKTYCYTDPLKEDIENRMKTIPLGTGFIFPDPADGESYPDFTRQPKFRKKYRFGRERTGQ